MKARKKAKENSPKEPFGVFIDYRQAMGGLHFYYSSPGECCASCKESTKTFIIPIPFASDFASEAQSYSLCLKCIIYMELYGDKIVYSLQEAFEFKLLNSD